MQREEHRESFSGAHGLVPRCRAGKTHERAEASRHGSM
jgi:hypothetical protein